MKAYQVEFLYFILCYSYGAVSCEERTKIQECLLSRPAGNVTQWQSNTQSMTVTVDWAYGKFTCYNKNTCYGIGEGDSNITMELQMIPIEIQYGVTLRFSASQAMTTSFAMQPFHVDESQFVSCNTLGGIPIVSEPTTQTFAVDPHFLQPGYNYFIVDTDDPEFKCGFGLRLQVLVKTHQCLLEDRLSEMCSGKGRCVSERMKETFTCECCPGFSGNFCHDLDGCASSPCQNGGSCHDVLNDLSGAAFTCQCPRGYTGSTCETKVNSMCDHRPCQNNATCIGNRTHFYCMCRHGYEGNFCEREKNECSSNPCVHGVCVNKLRGYQCYCIPGHGGHLCEHEYDECQSHPCHNSGRCIDKVNGYDCECGRGYTGKDCSVKLDLCQPSPCDPGITCIDRGNDFICQCPKGVSGKNCAKQTVSCSSNPCLNDGTCNESKTGYSCYCVTGTTGLHCETWLDRNVHKVENIAVDSPVSALYIGIGTLGCLLFIVILVLFVVYCRMHESYIPILDRVKQLKKSNNINKQKYVADVVSSPYISPDVVYEATSIDYRDSPLNVPLVSSLKPRKI